MGNTLCKDRGNQANKSKNPVDRIIGRCSQICPNSIGKRKHFWEKQVLETSPPHQTQPKLNESGWHSESLTVPDSPMNNKQQQPVAPPRKKRSTLKRDEQPTRNGFKDIFHDRSQSSESESQDIADAKDFTDFEKVPLNSAIEKESKLNEVASRSSEERDERNAVSLTRKVSKVGNKKSDKFFGENLSDCLSDEPVVSSDEEKSALRNDKKKEIENDKEEKEKSEFDMDVEDSEELIKKINKERGKLLFAMKDATDDESTDEPDGKVPVQEEIIVPKRRVTRHICDETDSIRPHVHKTAPDPNAPKKPQRDFSKYKKSLEDISKEDKSTDREIVVDKRIEVPVASAEPPSQSLKRVSESIPAQMSHSEKVLRRSLSTQSYLTQDLIDTIAKQASDLSISDKYVPEDYINFSDGSGLVSPNSKLQKKRSLGSQPSNSGSPVFSIGQQEVHYELPLSSDEKNIAIDSRDLPNEPHITTDADIITNLVKQKFTEEKQPELVQNKTENVKNVVEDKTPAEREHSPSEDISKAIKNFVEKDDLKPEDVLVLLEEEFGELLNSRSLPVEDIKVIEDLRKVVHNGLLEQQESHAKVTENDTKVEPIKEQKQEVSEPVQSPTIKESIEPKTVKEEFTKVTSTQNSDILVNQKENNKTIKPPSADNKIADIPSNNAPAPNEKRRHSIDELDHWFTGSKAVKADFPERKRKREKSYPGCLHSESLKEEFENFAANLIPPEEITNKQNVITTKTIKLSETPPVNDDKDTVLESQFDTSNIDKRKSVGHSLLLKFLDIERNHY